MLFQEKELIMVNQGHGKLKFCCSMRGIGIWLIYLNTFFVGFTLIRQSKAKRGYVKKVCFEIIKKNLIFKSFLL